MRLVADHAVHHVRAGFLQPVRQLDVGFLVEARAQLDDDGDVLAGCVDALTSASTIGESAPVRYSVCLIASTCGSAARLAQEIHHRREALERVVQQQVLLPDRPRTGRSCRPAGAAAPGVKIGYFQLGTRHEVVDRLQPVEVHRARHAVEVAAAAARTAAAGSRSTSLGQSAAVSSRTARRSVDARARLRARVAGRRLPRRRRTGRCCA